MSPVTHAYILVFITLALVALAARLFLTYQKTPSIKYFASMFLGLACLAGITAIILVTNQDSVFLFLTRLGYFAGVIVFSMMLMFSWHYPFPNKKVPSRSELFWIVPITFFLPFLLMGSMGVQGVEYFDNHFHEIAGSGFFLFPLFILVYFIWSLWNLFTKLSSVPREQKKNLQFVIGGLILGAGAAVLFDALLPFFNQPSRHYISIELSSVLIGITAYIVTRK